MIVVRDQRTLSVAAAAKGPRRSVGAGICFGSFLYARQSLHLRVSRRSLVSARRISPRSCRRSCSLLIRSCRDATCCTLRRRIASAFGARARRDCRALAVRSPIHLTSSYLSLSLFLSLPHSAFFSLQEKVVETSKQLSVLQNRIEANDRYHKRGVVTKETVVQVCLCIRSCTRCIRAGLCCWTRAWRGGACPVTWHRFPPLTFFFFFFFFCSPTSSPRVPTLRAPRVRRSMYKLAACI